MTDLIVPAPLWRRFAAALYDSFLLAAVWIIAAFVDAVIRNLLVLPYDAHVVRGYLFLTGLLFFGWFWTHGGQTLGMRAWRLQLRREDGAPLSWPQASWRYALAWLAWLPLGAGVLWCLLDRRRQAAHDRVAGTEVILLPRFPAKPE
jgi:uncharacterized RDD family membrane protein YckC